MNKGTFEKMIADGMTPDCPECGAEMEVGDPQKGRSGANGYKYKCKNPDCSKSGFAYISWYNVLFKSMQKKVLQLGLVAVGSISITGFTSYQFFSPSEQTAADPLDAVMQTEWSNTIDKFSDKFPGIKLALKSLPIESDTKSYIVGFTKILENELSALEKEKIKDSDKINLGIYYSRPSVANPKIRNNSDEAKKLLFAALKDEDASYSDQRWYEIVKALVMVRENIKDKEQFELLIKVINEHYSDPEKRQLALAEIYWAYALIGKAKERYGRSVYHFLTLAEMKENALTQGQIADVKRMLGKLSRSNSFVDNKKPGLYTALENSDLPAINAFREEWSNLINYPQTTY